MNIDELIASYNSIDQEYESRFHLPDEWNSEIEDRGGYVIKGREMNPSYLSFIPGREEVEQILLEPLRRLQSAQL